MSLQGKTALITGSTSGIGLAVAKSLAQQSATVILHGFDAPADLADQFPKKPIIDPTDLSDPKSIEEMMARLGPIDILVNNAGIQHTAPVENFAPEQWDRILAINLSSNYHTIRLALPHMREKKWGRIINIASVHGLVASTQKAAYVAAKHGVIGLTKVVGLETAGSGVTCNAICPGWVLTPLVQKQIDERAAKQGISVQQAQDDLLGEKQPSKQFVQPEEIGALAVYLCGPHGGAITGASLPIDGAWTAQ